MSAEMMEIIQIGATILVGAGFAALIVRKIKNKKQQTPPETKEN